MKLTFSIDYRTNWGESLYMLGDIPALGGAVASNAVKMEMADATTWMLETEVDSLPEEGVNYRYIVRNDHGGERHEWGKPHLLVPSPGTAVYNVQDRWRDLPFDKPFFSSAFTEGFLARHDRKPDIKPVAGSVLFSVYAPLVNPDEELVVCGDCKALGNWDPMEAPAFSDARFPLWTIAIPFVDFKVPFSYKFVIRKKNGSAVEWENGENRVCHDITLSPDKTVAINGLTINNPKSHWKGAGTAIPVFSIRTEDDFGCGDFMDIEKMVDWCAVTGQKILQLLPVNDTTMTGTWTDSYPYNANSTYALHPMYMRLKHAGELNDPARREYYDNLGKELNQLPQVDYERVNNAKNDYMRELYNQEKGEITANEEYLRFVSDNESWLMPYAAFCVLRDMNHTADMRQWGEYAVYNEDKVKEFCREHADEIGFVYFVQYHLDRQLRQARDYAHSKGMVLKGDIPIGISRTSVDAWLDPRLFNLDCQAGAPPDAFSAMGQNWGFPTYNWDEMARDGYKWWKNRFTKMAQFFDAYRIDHILGFFRIWQIPIDCVHGLLGTFNPALPYSADELRNNFDFWIDVDLQTKPLILDWMLNDFFGGYTAEAKERFLEPVSEGRYRLKEYVDTQRKVVDFFASEPENEKNNRLRDALMGLIDDVLFIEDPVQKGKYHPRISAQYTYQYRRLNDYEKWCFNRLYNDFFYHRNNDFWWGKAMEKLTPLTNCTRMLTCAEDLGMIPDCVPSVMHRLEILSLEIQRMPKDSSEEFGNTYAYPYYSVCTTSTHDMPGIRGWWEEDRTAAQHYYNHVLHQGGEAPAYAEPWICNAIIDINLQAPSMLCILPLQDWLSMDGDLRREKPQDEVINVPANPRHYWRYRMHLTVERLMQEDVYNQTIQALVRQSGR